ncbi:MAG: hypothetical protein H0W02_09290, partial [Ktedonobacteraceae bacterium]|nr:hypothetical protein [Ktedonobacteraceae bacterium]
RHHAWGQLKFYQLVNVLPFHDQQHTEQLIAIREQIQGTSTTPTPS